MVTGAGQGVGRGIALALAEEGARVAVVGRTAAKCEAVAAEITDRGKDAVAIRADATQRADVDVCVAEVRGRLGPISCLVNAAQQMHYTPLRRLTELELEAVWQSGAVGSLRFMQACFDDLRACRGSVIDVGSGSGLTARPAMGAYASVKEALRTMSRVAAGLGTRAFYRNFSTKDDLLLEMFRRDREAVLAQLREIVARAETPIEALRLWMTHMFDLVSDPRRRKRMATFYSEEMRRTPGYPRELELFATAEQAALAAILHRGRADGTFTECSPESDARSIRAAFEAAFLDRFHQKSTTDVADDVEHLMGFVLHGVGAV